MKANIVRQQHWAIYSISILCVCCPLTAKLRDVEGGRLLRSWIFRGRKEEVTKSRVFYKPGWWPDGAGAGAGDRRLRSKCRTSPRTLAAVGELIMKQTADVLCTQCLPVGSRGIKFIAG